MKTRSLDGAVYNEVVDAWMIPQADPYTLANFQAAYDKLAAGRSTQTLSKAQAAEFTPSKRLAPTHYALKIYPKTEEEQWRVETMEDVQVAYIPFDWVQLTPQEACKVEQSKTRSAANIFPEKSPYTVTYDYTDVTDGDSTDPRTFQLPILYTVWPASKPLPTDLEHVVDYAVFLPDATTDRSLSKQAMPVLWGEALSLVMPEEMAKTRATAAQTRAVEIGQVPGRLVTPDNVLGTNVPLVNLKVRFQTGTNITDRVSSYGGYVTLDYPETNGGPGTVYQVSMQLIYEDPNGRWTIVPGSGGNTYLVPKTTTFISLPSSQPVLYVEAVINSTAHQENEIHRAVNHYFNSQSVFPKTVPSGGLNIVAANYDDPKADGGRYFSGSRHIEIYNNGSTHNLTIGTTLHEIGHAAHHFAQPALFNSNAQLFLCESVASYVGAYLGESCYTSLGLINLVGWLPDGISGQARQSWADVSSDSYSPLFVDLWDQHNQYHCDAMTPDDDIENVPASVIWNVIATSPSWVSCRSKLDALAGTGSGKYYSRANFDKWIVCFD